MRRSMPLWAVLLAAWPAAAGQSGKVARIERLEVVRSEMVFVPQGWFLMGFDVRDSEARAEHELACRTDFPPPIADAECDESNVADASPQRRVFLYDFWIDRLEVTVRDYRACVAAGACDVAALLSGDLRYTLDPWPMVNVTWRDAADYCAWLGKRLPTEAEWEKAARGDDGRRWPWGNQERDDGANHGRVEIELSNQPQQAWLQLGDRRDGFELVAPPGSLPWGESPYGALDLAGNVSEWVADYYSGSQQGYAGLGAVAPVQNAPQANANLRTVRGGSWVEPRLWGRTYFRRFAPPDVRAFYLGFRCARSDRD